MRALYKRQRRVTPTAVRSVRVPDRAGELNIVFRLYLPCEKLDGGGGGQSWKDLPCITVPAPPILNN